MATGTRPGLADRLRARFEFDHAHDRTTKALVLGAAVLLGAYAGYLLADLGLRTVAFVVVTAWAAYGLYARPTRRDVAIRGLYALAVLVLATPVALAATIPVLPHGTAGIENLLGFVVTIADLVLLAVFGAIAAVPAGVAFLLDRRR
jgi:hypothetical protein